MTQAQVGLLMADHPGQGVSLQPGGDINTGPEQPEDKGGGNSVALIPQVRALSPPDEGAPGPCVPPPL